MMDQRAVVDPVWFLWGEGVWGEGVWGEGVWGGGV